MPIDPQMYVKSWYVKIFWEFRKSKKAPGAY